MNYKEEKDWEFVIGTYPGFLFGFRIYEDEDSETFALYIPFVNFTLTIDK